MRDSDRAGHRYIPDEGLGVTFEQWWQAERGGTNIFEFETARDAWNAAIEEAAKLVDALHDPCEPWMEGSDVRALRHRET